MPEVNCIVLCAHNANKHSKPSNVSIGMAPWLEDPPDKRYIYGVGCRCCERSKFQSGLLLSQAAIRCMQIRNEQRIRFYHLLIRYIACQLAIATGAVPQHHRCVGSICLSAASQPTSLRKFVAPQGCFVMSGSKVLFLKQATENRLSRNFGTLDWIHSNL